MISPAPNHLLGPGIIHKSRPPRLAALENRLLDHSLAQRAPLARDNRTEGFHLFDLVFVFLLDDLAASTPCRARAATSAYAAVAASRVTTTITAAGAGGVVAGEESARGGGGGDVEHGAFEGGFFAFGEDEAAWGGECCGFVVCGC